MDIETEGSFARRACPTTRMMSISEHPANLDNVCLEGLVNGEWDGAQIYSEPGQITINLGWLHDMSICRSLPPMTCTKQTLRTFLPFVGFAVVSDVISVQSLVLVQALIACLNGHPHCLIPRSRWHLSSSSDHSAYSLRKHSFWSSRSDWNSWAKMGHIEFLIAQPIN